MRTNHVKAKLKNGEASIGAWLSLGSVNVARIMARMGFDWLTVDCEHTALNPTLMADIVATIADAHTAAPIVRLPTNSVEWYKWALDAGAWGVIVPMVNNREEAERAVALCKYPPHGTRSIGGVFASYGFDTTVRTRYAAEANNQILVIVQIESAAGLANVEEICSVPGLDVAFIGPNDLHAQIGLTPSSEGAEPEFVAALERVKAAAHRNNVALGMYSSDGSAAAQRVREGFHMISATTDATCLMTAAAENFAAATGKAYESA